MHSRLAVIVDITFSLFNSYLLSPYYVPDTILVSKNNEQKRLSPSFLELTFLNSSPEKHPYLMTALTVKGILLSDLLKCGEGRVHLRMGEIVFCHCIGTKLLTNLDCGSSGFLRHGFSSLGTY